MAVVNEKKKKEPKKEFIFSYNHSEKSITLRVSDTINHMMDTITAKYGFKKYDLLNKGLYFFFYCNFPDEIQKLIEQSPDQYNELAEIMASYNNDGRLSKSIVKERIAIAEEMHSKRTKKKVE